MRKMLDWLLMYLQAIWKHLILYLAQNFSLVRKENDMVFIAVDKDGSEWIN